METFPKIDLFPRITRAGEFIKRLVHFLPETPLASHGDHSPTERTDQLQLDFTQDK